MKSIIRIGAKSVILLLGALFPADALLAQSCPIGGTILCASQATGSLTSTDCRWTGAEFYADLYAIDTIEGFPLTLTYIGDYPLRITIQRINASGTLSGVIAQASGTGSISVSFTPETGRYLVVVTSTQPFAGGNYTVNLTCGAFSCSANATTLCLNGGRFQVRTNWRAPSGASGAGQAVQLTGDSGYFWFFNSANIEMIVKSLNGCALNNRHWVFSGGLTNVEVTTTVTDMKTGVVQTYLNSLNTPFAPVQDTSAFATCP